MSAKKPPNLLVRPLGYDQLYIKIILAMHMSTNAENMGRLVKYLLRYSLEYADFSQFFCPVVAKISQTPL